jgi:hypothetical protein
VTVNTRADQDVTTIRVKYSFDDTSLSLGGLTSRVCGVVDLFTLASGIFEDVFSKRVQMAKLEANVFEREEDLRFSFDGQILRLARAETADNCRLLRISYASPLEIILTISTASGAFWWFIRQLTTAKERWAEARTTEMRERLKQVVYDSAIEIASDAGIFGIVLRSGDDTINELLRRAADAIIEIEEIERLDADRAVD